MKIVLEAVGSVRRRRHRRPMRRSRTEPFLARLPFLTDLKFRASWGQLGNSGIPNYAYISQFTAGSNYMGNSGVSQSNPSLNHLRWETSESTNLGYGPRSVQSRIVVTLDLYNKLTKDLLFNLPDSFIESGGRRLEFKQPERQHTKPTWKYQQQGR